MENSPLKKRPKVGVSYDETENNLQYLIGLRLNVVEMLEKLSTDETNLWFKNLEKVQFKLPQTDNYVFPNIDELCADFKHALKQCNDKKKIICDYIKFLTILKKKEKCSISKLVDEI